MAKRRGNKLRLPQHTKGIDLDHISDTSATTEEPLSESKRRKARGEMYEKIDPPFRGAGDKEKPIMWSDVGLIWKVGIGIATFFIIVVIPVVWFASSLNTNVETLQGDVRDVKDKTAELVSNSVKHSQRLDGLEKSVSEIGQNLSSSRITEPDRYTPNKPIKPTQ